MAKRKAPARRNKSKRKSTKNKGPTWRMWLVALLLILAFVGLLLVLKHTRPNHKPEALSTLVREHMPTLTKHTQPPPKFEFYTLLPSAKEQVPAPVKLNSNAAPTAPVVSLTPTPPIQQLSLLQVSAFRQYKDADNLKAKLLLQGFNTNVQTLTGNNVTWYRVLVGPFASPAALAQAQQQLKALHYDPIKATMAVAKPAPLPTVVKPPVTGKTSTP